MTADNQQSIQNNVLKAIKEGQVKMRPKWHFILRATLIVTGIIAIIFTLLYLASLTLFVLRQTGVLFVPAFGPRGWFEFFVSLPWILVLLLLIFILVLEVLVRRYSFAFRRPLLYSAVSIIIIISISGVLLERTHVHNRISNFAQRRHMPFAGPMYRQFDEGQFLNVHRGKVVEQQQNGFVMRNIQGENLIVLITRQTRLPIGADFALEDTVVVFGRCSDHTIIARGIQEIEE